MRKKNYIIYLKTLFTIFLVFLFSCQEDREHRLHTEGEKKGISEIKNRGKIVAVTEYNSTNYFVYKGEPMGYQYELLLSLADYLGVKLEVIVSNDLTESFEKLNNGTCDLIATNLTVTRERSKTLNFTEPHLQARQVLVQRKPDGWSRMNSSQLESMMVRNQLYLGGKTIYVQNGSVYGQRLRALSDEIGDSIHIVELGGHDTEQLIKLVADGEIDFAVCDEYTGRVSESMYPNIDVETSLSFPQKLAWAVKPGDDALKSEIDRWMQGYKLTAKYSYTFNRYYKNSRAAHIVNSEYYTLNSGKVSQFDDIFRESSKLLGWDWKLLASLVYQESNFDPNVKSWAGAFGLMQLMPSTAERFGIDSLSSPQKHIEAGVKYIQWLDGILLDKITDREERIKFVIAAYNVGLGHVLDARRLAEKYKKDPNIWTGNVDYFILHKSNPEYYQDPVVKYGYCRGEEPYRYVTEILDRFKHYSNFISE
jgi:membrane-bound lytic murein transglycosylase F